MCHTHGAEFTKRKNGYIYFDDMIILTKSENSHLSYVIFLVLNLQHSACAHFHGGTCFTRSLFTEGLICFRSRHFHQFCTSYTAPLPRGACFIFRALICTDQINKKGVMPLSVSHLFTYISISAAEIQYSPLIICVFA